MSRIAYYNGVETKAVTSIRFQEIYQKYADVAEIFTVPQWEVLSLYYGKGLTQKQTAENLGIDRRTVSGRLTRARQRLAVYQKQMRAEQFRLLRSECWQDEE